MYQQEANRADQKTCLRLPYSQGRASECSKHMPTPRRPDRNDLAVYIVLHQGTRCAPLPWTRPFLLFHLDLLVRRCPTVRLRLSALARLAMSCFVLAILSTVIGHARALRIGVRSGREDRGRGDGPIRHGALAAIGSASARAISLQGGEVHGAHASWHAAGWLQGQSWLWSCLAVMHLGIV